MHHTKFNPKTDVYFPHPNMQPGHIMQASTKKCKQDLTLISDKQKEQL